MSETLTEGSFDLNGYRFGGESDPLVVGPGGFDMGVTEPRIQDQENPVGDNLSFGRDLLKPQTWTWTMKSNLDDLPTALDALEHAQEAWRQAREAPGLVVPLDYCLGGRQRRVYGRPRRFTHDLRPLAWQGEVNVLADFVRADTLYYSDTAQVVDLSLTPGAQKGLATPLIGPLTTIGSITASGTIGAFGTAPSPFIAILYGPITSPWLEGPGWRIELSTSIPAGQHVVIDTRPWAQTVTRGDGASLAGALSRGTRLLTARIPPGIASGVTLGGIDGTGTAHCQITWRPAYRSL